VDVSSTVFKPLLCFAQLAQLARRLTRRRLIPLVTELKVGYRDPYGETHVYITATACHPTRKASKRCHSSAVSHLSDYKDDKYTVNMAVS